MRGGRAEERKGRREGEMETCTYCCVLSQQVCYVIVQQVTTATDPYHHFTSGVYVSLVQSLQEKEEKEEEEEEEERLSLPKCCQL